MLRAPAPLAFLLFVAAVPAASQDGANRIRASLAWLAADTADRDSAAYRLARRFAQMGLVQPDGAARFLHWFTIGTAAPGAGGARAANVIGMLPGQGALADEAVVASARYDHPGFDADDASGTAALLEVARNLRQRPGVDRRTIVVVAFTVQELGRIGSQHATDHPAIPVARTVAIVNLDRVGRLRDNRLLALGVATALEWQPLLDSLNRFDLEILASGDGGSRGDPLSFLGGDIPVVRFSTDPHEEYDRVTDDAPPINAQGIARVAALAADLVWALAVRPTRLTWMAAPPAAPADTATVGHNGT